MEHFDLDVGTMNIEELDKQIQLKKQQKIQMKQELLRRKHENDIDLEKKIRKEINNHTLEILLKRAENNENPEENPDDKPESESQEQKPEVQNDDKSHVSAGIKIRKNLIFRK